jgi:hypothetical protein
MGRIHHLLSLVGAAAAFSWTPLICPPPEKAVPSSCTEPAHAFTAAFTFFFQIESSTAASFSCVDGAGRALCARSWTNSSESGAAGSCFFLLPAGVGYTCASSGAVNMIDASFAPAAANRAPALAPPPAQPLACPGGALTAGGGGGGGCTLAAGASDRWVHAAWRGAAGGGGAFSCAAAGAAVCAWGSSALGPADGSSCAFLLPAGAALECAASRGRVDFSQSTALAFEAPYAAAGARPAPAGDCPPSSPKPNDCDCSHVNNATSATDEVVTIVSSSVDDGFNAFHCFVAGVNVCGWGSNRGERGSLGTCSFIVPAGEEYACSMQWGAAAFPNSTITRTAVSLFVNASAPATSATRAPARGLPAPPAAAAAAEPRRLDALFAAWRAEHGVRYAGAAEEARARANFAAHVATADAAARKLRGAPHADALGRPTRFNRFADMERGAWERAYRGGAARAAAHVRESRAAAAALPPLPPPPPPPPAADWRAAGVVTPVKDQGECGSCWSFSTTGAVESAWALAKNPLVALSEQRLVSCDNTSYGCDGGFPNTAMDWTRDNGAVTEASYPYASGDGVTRGCTTTGNVAAAANVTGWRLVPGNTSAATEAALAAWLAAYGPVSILVDAMTQLWWVYTGGVMTGCCDVSTDHAVLLVGYNFSDARNKYWVIKNSWGEAWGEGGYVRLAAGENECGIGTFPVIATVAGGLLPPPPPPPPPRPVWQCAPDAQSVNTSGSAACVWTNGTSAEWRMPGAGVEADCTYMKDGAWLSLLPPAPVFRARPQPAHAPYPPPPPHPINAASQATSVTLSPAAITRATSRARPPFRQMATAARRGFACSKRATGASRGSPRAQRPCAATCHRASLATRGRPRKSKFLPASQAHV